MINRKCPYCGGEHMSADCDVRIPGVLQADGSIKVNPWWDLKTLKEDSFVSESEEYIHGFCYDCGSECDFSWTEGFIKGD